MIDPLAITAALTDALTPMAGDKIIFVAPNGVQTEITGIEWDSTLADAEGLEIDQAGMRNSVERNWFFMQAWLKGITLDVAGYFLKDGVRWDFVKDVPIYAKIVPIAGAQSAVQIRVTPAVEINSSVSGRITLGD